MKTTWERVRWAAGVVAAVVGTGVGTGAVAAPSLKVCMAESNPPLSYQAEGVPRGLDARLAQALADALQRPLQVVPFESEFEADKHLAHEVNALLSSGVCDVVSGFPLMASDLGPPSRPTARVPDYPGAPRRSLRPWVPLGPLVPSHAYHAMGMGLVVRDRARIAMTLAQPGDARIGVQAGTVAGTVVTLFHQGRLRAQTVALAQGEDALAGLEAGRFDATLVLLDRYDAWRLAHPHSRLLRAAYVHPLRINLGLVFGAQSSDLVAAANRLIDGALGSGELSRWASLEGGSWLAPQAPELSAPIGLAELLRD